MDWKSLVERATRLHLQNRLGFAVTLARGVRSTETLSRWEHELDTMRLDQEDTFCSESMTSPEPERVRGHRSSEAAHWNIISDLSAADLRDVFDSAA